MPNVAATGLDLASCKVPFKRNTNGLHLNTSDVIRIGQHMPTQTNTKLMPIE
jgi:hypothetical protein